MFQRKWRSLSFALKPVIAALFQQFRQKYPAGHLTTELLMLQDGLYIVRAALADGDAPIVTAMAASTDLNQSEQQAQAKALSLLGFMAPGQTELPSTAPSAPPPTPTAQPATVLFQSSSSPAPVGAPSAHHPTSTVPSAVPPAETETVASDALLEEPDEDRPISDIPELPISELPNPELPSSDADGFVPDLSAFDTASTDLSDVIAQTDVEMRRLGWTSQQGREYLEQTYRKRSRQQLTDEELLEFLLYLESQPVPAG